MRSIRMTPASVCCADGEVNLPRGFQDIKMVDSVRYEQNQIE